MIGSFRELLFTLQVQHRSFQERNTRQDTREFNCRDVLSSLSRFPLRTSFCSETAVGVKIIRTVANRD